MKNLSLLSFLLLIFLSCKKQVRKEIKKPNIFYEQAYDFLDKKMPDSAFPYFAKAKDLYLIRRDSLGIAKCLVQMGIISSDKHDYFGAQELSLNALSYLDKKNKDQYPYIHPNYNNLAIATYQLEDYNNAIKFYDLAIKFSTKSSDINLYMNNKGKFYQQIDKFPEALKIFRQILHGTYKNQKEYARALTNSSYTKWLQDHKFNPVPDYFHALHIRENEADLIGRNSSYSHLSDYYAETPLKDSALFYARKMYQVATEANSYDDRLSALHKLIDLSPATKTKHYFEIYLSLRDSVQTARAVARNQFALIRYESEKNIVNNLKLQKDNTAKRYQIVKQNVMLFGALFLLVGGSCSATYWYRKRKQRMELESLNAIRESQLKTSKRVHDVVANGLYRVMSEMQNQEGMDKEDVLDKIDDLYEKSRDISYEKPEVTDQNFDRRIAALLLSFSTEKTKVAIAGNTLDLWEKVNSAVRYEIEHILQELMVNMKKHSCASNVTVRFNYKNDEINIFYTDNGVGMPEGTNFKNGLRNTGNRIEDICGEIIFDTKLEKGLKIQISFPIS